MRRCVLCKECHMIRFNEAGEKVPFRHLHAPAPSIPRRYGSAPITGHMSPARTDLRINRKTIFPFLFGAVKCLVRFSIQRIKVPVFIRSNRYADACRHLHLFPCLSTPFHPLCFPCPGDVIVSRPSSCLISALPFFHKYGKILYNIRKSGLDLQHIRYDRGGM